MIKYLINSPIIDRKNTGNLPQSPKENQKRRKANFAWRSSFFISGKILCHKSHRSIRSMHGTLTRNTKPGYSRPKRNVNEVVVYTFLIS